MKLKTTVIIIFASLLFSAYSTVDNDNIRFGAPRGGGVIIVKHGFVISYDKLLKSPLWSSYHLKKENISAAPNKPGAFLADNSLKAADRLSRGDYPSYYEKCPMAPVRDMAYDKKACSDAFKLSNVCLMSPGLKNGKWKELEGKVRDFVEARGGAWIVTGPVFDHTAKKQKRAGKAGIAVAKGFFKIILYQTKDYAFRTAGFYMDNTACPEPLSSYMTSVADIEAKSGLVFFPSFPPDVQVIMKKSAADPFFGK